MADVASPPAEGQSARPTDLNTWVVGVTHGDFFAMPVLYRVLIANCVVLVVGALLGTALTTELRGHNRSSVFIIFVISGILLSLVVNFVLLKMAFDPIRRVRDTMRRVEAGDMTLRAPISGYDPDADELAATFNHMLGKLNESSRSRASQILRAQEEERKRIARELHDETSQALTSLLVTLKLVEERTTDPDAQARVAQSREVAHQTLRAIRNLSIDLRPSALDDLGLAPALHGYIREYQQKYGLDVQFTVHGFKERAGFEVETALYRIVQEALTNIARHAHATHVTVDLRQAAGQAELRVTDDGRGFDLAAPHKAPGSDGGLGLVGIRERVSLLGGQLEVQSALNHGTTIWLTLPFHSDDQRGSDASTATDH